MRILRSYILRETIVPFLLSLCVLTCVFLLGNLIQLANLVINKGVHLATVGEIFILYFPVLIGYTLPIATLIAIILTMSRFSADNEIIAIRASGIYLGRILWPLAVIGLILSLCSLIMNERVIPYAHHKQRVLMKTLGVKNPTALLEAGIFIKSFDNQILFIHKIDGNKMHNITIYQPQPDGPTRTIIARQGEFTPVPDKDQIKLKLIDGTSDEPSLGDSNSFYKLNFENYFMTLDFGKEKKTIGKKPKSMTLKELKSEKERLEHLLVKNATFATEYHRKISWSFAPFFFIMLGFPIAVITHRREKSANIVIAMIGASLYYVLTIGAEALSTKGVLTPAIIMWTPNVIVGSLAAYLNYKCVS